MLFADCCHVAHQKEVVDTPLRKKLPKAKAPHPRCINVGIGSLAAGEVTLAEVQPPAFATPFPSLPAFGANGAKTLEHGGVPLQTGQGFPPGTPNAARQQESGDDIMPFRRQKTAREINRRKSITCMEGYLDESTRRGSGAASPRSPRSPGAKEEAPASGAQGGSSGAPPEEEEAAAQLPSRRNSTHDLFAQPSQTFIVLDWDDTLFPTTYVRDDLGLCWQTPMKNQRLDAREKSEITRNLHRCAENCCSLLRAAAAFGKVVLVTLAKSPWVSVSCDHFFPAVGLLIQELGVPVIYAQEGQEKPPVDYNKSEMTSSENIERHWSQVKGKAIAKEITTFYSQYAGQSWKNIISIGDSDFERLGTMQATEGYMKQTGISRSKTVEVNNHVYKVRTKTFKMLDQPSVDELTVELAMVQKWLPLMIQMDGSFDVNLDDLEDPATLRRIERTLRGQQPRNGSPAGTARNACD
mmetsp:Transcript_16997/g.53407  ORF Transcript_16997/g.53407 Transcript_16997/m.53407 type:complete len:467 (+) Transcript_16997:102-1502(+)